MSKRVLVCEDDHAIRLLLHKLLSRHGLEVDAVATGAEALMHLRRAAYDLVLLDLLTPVVSGYDVVDVLRMERPWLLDRVIVVTALQRAFQEPLPVAAILRKPFDVDELDRTVERVLSRSSRRRPDEGRLDGAMR